MIAETYMYRVVVTKDYEVDAPGRKQAWRRGEVLHEGDSLPHAQSNRSGITEDGYIFVMGHGWTELIPKNHLDVSRWKIVPRHDAHLSWIEALNVTNE